MEKNSAWQVRLFSILHQGGTYEQSRMAYRAAIQANASYFTLKARTSSPGLEVVHLSTKIAVVLRVFMLAAVHF
ncbi:hypothetical protein E4U21_003862 [Claviceps maximensis]|nr:hypothetical protein E4U21_003862 [Claviceps maximensis]